MAGLAQKGGSVFSYIRLAHKPEDIHAIRIAAHGADLVLAEGSMGLFDKRKYYYEPSLLYLQPPWFPLINDSLTTVLFRELQA